MAFTSPHPLLQECYGDLPLLQSSPERVNLLLFLLELLLQPVVGLLQGFTERLRTGRQQSLTRAVGTLMCLVAIPPLYCIGLNVCNMDYWQFPEFNRTVYVDSYWGPVLRGCYILHKKEDLSCVFVEPTRLSSRLSKGPGGSSRQRNCLTTALFVKNVNSDLVSGASLPTHTEACTHTHTLSL